MTTTPQAPPLTRAQVEVWLHEFARAEHLPPIEVYWREGHTHDLTEQTRTGYRITLSDGWLADPDTMRGVAAHELGHVAGRHREGHTFTVALVACALVMPTAWWLFSVAVGHLHRHTHGHLAIMVTCSVVSIVAGVFAGLFVGWVAAYRQRRRRPALEFEADTWAAEHGYPLTATQRDTMTRHYPTPRARRWWWPATHPTWDERYHHPANQAVLAAFTPGSSGQGPSTVTRPVQQGATPAFWGSPAGADAGRQR